MNTDAAFISNSGACAVVARNADAKFEGGGTCGHNCNFPMEAEAKAITLAFDLAEKMEWKDIIVESDAEKVIKVLNSEVASYPWRLRSMLLQIKDRVKLFNRVCLKFIKKGATVQMRLHTLWQALLLKTRLLTGG